MNIQINGLVPLPLQDKLSNRPSDIWLTQTTFTSGNKIKIKAASGTGKTTLVHMLYKLRHDYVGEILINGRLLPTIKNNQLAALRQQSLSIVFQDMRLFDQLTALENIELKRVLAQPVLYQSKVIGQMAEQLGILHILNQKAGNCSYGERQRIAIIRALMQPFKWLIMDEPFSHLDHLNIDKAASLIATECAKRAAGLIITDLEHDAHFDYTQQYQL